MHFLLDSTSFLDRVAKPREVCSSSGLRGFGEEVPLFRPRRLHWSKSLLFQRKQLSRNIHYYVLTMWFFQLDVEDIGLARYGSGNIHFHKHLHCIPDPITSRKIRLPGIQPPREELTLHLLLELRDGDLHGFSSFFSRLTLTDQKWKNI